MRPLKIAFDAKRLFHNREGLGAYARTLVRDLKAYHPDHQYYLCTPSLGDNDYAAEFREGEAYEHILPSSGSGPGWWWRSKGVVKALEQYEIDVYWGLSNELPYGIAGANCKSIVTIHDLLYKTFPQQFGRADRLIYQRKFKAATTAADVIVVPSQHTLRDLNTYFPESAEQKVVLGQAVAESYRSTDTSRTHSPKQDYYLVVGSINERKNLRLVIEAYALLPEQERKQVVIVGSGKKYKHRMEELISQKGLESFFEFRTGVSNAALKELYQQARALLFPSLYEGYGRPVVEALTLGIPVICLQNSSIPEVVGKHGIIIGYDSPEAFKKALVQMNKEEVRVALMKDVKEHLKKFEPENLSKMAVSIMTDIAGF